MKFIPLPSRGGKYLVATANITYLRTHENNQVKIGLVGGESIQVDGNLDEVSALLRQ
ncbi:hypothetical protein [Sphingomicrobium sediminis]|uniref:HTH LytTR-type domain-containing protein n=1 Tax=Sphingomicrobium sediminis TaxID=2950949 RepID=A0A9X2J120_9SPHN|nr:hypothetical protein [Sphingomicrobium sediminis]MCM8556269.1 hypothetical protein [Sphingomicrobium sediminis]